MKEKKDAKILKHCSWWNIHIIFKLYFILLVELLDSNDNIPAFKYFLKKLILRVYD